MRKKTRKRSRARSKGIEVSSTSKGTVSSTARQPASSDWDELTAQWFATGDDPPEDAYLGDEPEPRRRGRLVGWRPVAPRTHAYVGLGLLASVALTLVLF